MKIRKDYSHDDKMFVRQARIGYATRHVPVRAGRSIGWRRWNSLRDAAVALLIIRDGIFAGEWGYSRSWPQKKISLERYDHRVT